MTSQQYIVEPGTAKGFWVLDSYNQSAYNNRRYMRWFPALDSAESHAKMLNTTDTEEKLK